MLSLTRRFFRRLSWHLARVVGNKILASGDMCGEYRLKKIQPDNYRPENYYQSSLYVFINLSSVSPVTSLKDKPVEGTRRHYTRKTNE